MRGCGKGVREGLRRELGRCPPSSSPLFSPGSWELGIRKKGNAGWVVVVTRAQREDGTRGFDAWDGFGGKRNRWR